MFSILSGFLLYKHMIFNICTNTVCSNVLI